MDNLNQFQFMCSSCDEMHIEIFHFRNQAVRPYIELEPTNHPLALAQTNGISDQDLIRIYEYYVHGKKE